MACQKIALAGLSHDHVWIELKKWLALSHIEIVAAFDENPTLLSQISQKIPSLKTYTQLSALLKENRIDAAQITTSNDNTLSVAQQLCSKNIPFPQSLTVK